MARLLLHAALLGALSACKAAPTASTEHFAAEIRETSGLARSEADPTMVWALGDSGTPATLFALDEQGVVRARVAVESANNVDWEDLTIHAGKLYVGDVGNNSQARRDLAVYVIDEPDPRGGDQSVRPVAALPFEYADQAEFPARLENFDAESLSWTRGALHLLSKDRADTRTRVYRFDPANTGTSQQRLEALEHFDVGGKDLRYGGMVTAAEAHPDGTRLAVLTYHALFIFDVDHQGPLLSRLANRVDFDMSQLGQCEALTWEGEGVMIVNEDGRVFHVNARTVATGERWPVSKPGP